MRISRIRVDGYGVLSDFAVDDLPPGLTVFIGPNEAGKSTLLDFVRGVLFGFPDRRHRAPFHQPVHGGRHGGAVHLLTDSGGELVLERHLDAKAPTLLGPDGAPRDVAEFGAVLGGADATLFRSVFAFGLEELTAFDSLEKDEVRDLVFSAGVLGAGRSATRAGRAIEARRAELVRQRTDAVANRLGRELEAIDADLRSARHAATELPARLRERATLADALAEARRAAEQAHRRRSEPERLQAAGPISRHRTQVLDELASIAGDECPPVLAVAGVVTRLVEERSGDLARQRRRSELVEDHRTLAERVGAARARLGLAADALATWDEQLGERAQAISEAAHELAAECRSTELRHDEARHAFSVRTSTPPPAEATRPLEALDGAAESLRELRTHIRERDLAEKAPQAAATGSTSGAAFAISVAVLAGATVVALLLAGSHQRPSTLAIALVGAIALLAAVAAVVAPRRRGARQLTSDAPDATAERRDREIERLCRLLDLAGDVTDPGIDSALSRLEKERERRRGLDDWETGMEHAREELSGLEARLSSLDAERRALDVEAIALARACGISVPVDAESIGGSFRILAELGTGAIELGQLRSAIAVIDGELTAYRAELAATAKAAGIAIGESIDDTLQGLRGALDEANEREARVAELRRSAAGLSHDLDGALDIGADSERVRSELEKNDVLGWAEELSEIDASAGELDAGYDTALAALHDVERALDELQASDVVADLELRREGVAAALDHALREWVVLGIAEALLDETLEHYERERQPAVIEAAASLFSSVTANRWISIVPREDPDNPKRRSIDVIAPSGHRVAATELSRGTAEQLYLCLRLAFAATFAERAVALPFVLDDVLVNFDPERAAAMAGAIATTAAHHQVLVFTCHPHVVDHLVEAGDDVRVVQLDRI